MSGKRVVGGKVVMGVAALCIVLLVITVGFLGYQNLSFQSQASSEKATVASLNARLNSAIDSLNGLNATVASLQNQVTSDNATNTDLQGRLENKTVSLTSANNQVSRLQNLLFYDDANIKDQQNQISTDQLTINGLKAQISNLQSTLANWNAPVIDGFSLVQITDTQYLSDKNPALLNTLTSWIVNNNVALNVSMVIHTGDLVQSPDNASNWQNANAAMMQFYNNGVPYCWCAGNHDFIGETSPAGNDDGYWLGGGYSAFNVSAMQQEPYWTASIFGGSSTAVQFSYGNYRFMVINVAYDSNQTVLDWMQTLLKCNPNDNVIVTTHNFLNGNGTYGYTVSPEDVDWAENFESILSNYTNVFMTLNGHDVGEGVASTQRIGNREEIFFNRQELDAETGAACARIYTFNMSNPSHPVVNVYTYQTYSNSNGGPAYLTDQPNQFSFTSNLTAYSPQTVSLAGGTSFLGSSGFNTTFANPITLAAYNQTGNLLRFYNLTLNGYTSNLTVSSVGANIVIGNSNSTSLSYTVNAGGGTQTFLLNTQPTSVIIDGASVANGHGWSYLNGVVTVTGATKSVTVNLT